MKLLSFLFGISKTTVSLSILASVISGISSIGLIAVINLSLEGQSSLPITYLAWGFAGLCLLRLLAGITSQVVLTSLGQGAIFDLRLRLSRQILATPLRKLEEIGVHRLLAALTTDTSTIIGALISVPILCLNLVIVGGCLLYLGWLSWPVFLAVIVFMVIGIATYQLPMNRAFYYFKQARDNEDALFHHFEALTSGVKELKLHYKRQKSYISRALRPTAANLKHNLLYGMSFHAAASSWGNLLFFLFIGLLLFVLPSISISNNQNVISYTLIILFMMTPLQGILSSLPSLSRAKVALNKLDSLGLSLTKPDSVTTHNDSQPSPYITDLSEKYLELINVTHTYCESDDDRVFTLGPLNLAFQKGEVVFLIGGNGSGKTTLAKLITGLYKPEAGEFRLNGKTVGTKIDWEHYYQLFSVIFSDFYLFNNLFGLNTAELDNDAQRYLTQLQLEHKVAVQNGSFSTIDLSQGQRKRLALLVAYLEDRPFYIFDEWAAEQDPLFREIFYTQILADLRQRGKTVLVISHDERYYHLADRTLKLEYGQLL